MTAHHPHQPEPGDPIDILDVSPHHSHLPVAPAPSRAARAVATTRANIVRLIPGMTPLPLGVPLGGVPSLA